jgi:phage terminase large subunit-like protein
MSNQSLAEQVAALPEDQRALFFSDIDQATMQALQYDADFWLRPNQKIPEGDWYITALVAGRGFGKMLDVSTKVPTPTGWVKLGEISDGDEIFDEQGNICRVVQAHPIQFPKKAYRLTFSDGASIVAGEEHLWTTWTHSDRKSYNRRNDYVESDESVGLPDNWPTWTKPSRWGHPTDIGPKTRTTQDIVDTFTHGKRGDLNHSIPVALPLKYTEKHLPVDPYLYGVYLGDGNRRDGSITSHNNECLWLISEFESRGFDLLGQYPGKLPDGTYKNCSRLSFRGFAGVLREAGLLGNKNIPEEYLRGSIDQRKDLLAGLLDTDGHIGKANVHIEFCTVTKDHADAVMELARSLGQKPSLYVGRAKLNGRDCGPKYRVCWRPTYNPFRMPRKMGGYLDPGPQASRNMHRMITKFEEVPLRPMRCLTVDSPNHLFLVGEAMIPTHNTRAMSEWIRRMAIEHPGCRIGIAARTSADVRNTVVTGESGILAVHPDSQRPEYKPSTTSLHWPNGSSALLLSSESPDSARGPQFHFSTADEFAAWKTTPDSSGATLYDNLIAATRLGENPQLLLATTPKRTRVMRELMEQSKDPEERIHIIRGSTFDNKMLSDRYIANLTRRYGNSDLAKQELYGEMLGDAEGLIFTTEMINNAKEIPVEGRFPLRIIAVDPSVSADPSNRDDCGIMAIGSTIDRDLSRRTAAVLEDYSINAAPDVWAKVVADAAYEQQTKFVVVEKNQGGALLQMAINAVDPTLKVFPVVATKGKRTRSEPVVIAMQQGRVAIACDSPILEDQMLFYDPEDRNSPDRLDAMVWGIISTLISPPPGLRPGRTSTTSAARRKIGEFRGQRASGQIGRGGMSSYSRTRY